MKEIFSELYPCSDAAFSAYTGPAEPLKLVTAARIAAELGQAGRRDQLNSRGIHSLDLKMRLRRF